MTIRFMYLKMSSIRLNVFTTEGTMGVCLVHKIQQLVVSKDSISNNYDKIKGK